MMPDEYLEAAEQRAAAARAPTTTPEAPRGTPATDPAAEFHGELRAMHKFALMRMAEAIDEARHYWIARTATAAKLMRLAGLHDHHDRTA